MGKEAIGYLEPDAQVAIETWVTPILPLLDKYPHLCDLDLVIEGGVGNGVEMSHVTRWLLPQAVYVGTDLVEGVAPRMQRQSRSIEPAVLSRVHAANANPTETMDDAIIYANCFDFQLVRDIMTRTGRQLPIFASFNALFALFDRKKNPWDSKTREDVIAMHNAVSPEMPFVAQLHIGVNWEDEGRTVRSSSYFALETEANKSGWITERFENGLLLLRPQIV